MAKLAGLHAEGVNDLDSYNLGVIAERERIVKWMEKFIPDGHLEHEECDDCLVIRTVIAMIKEE